MKRRRSHETETLILNPINRRTFLGTLSALLAAALPFSAHGAPSTPIAVAVDPHTPLGKLPPMGLGFSTEKHLIGTGDFYIPANSDFTGLCRRLGPQVLRVGGTHVDGTIWSPDGRGHQNGTVAPSDIERFAAYIKTLGWKVVYGVNLAHTAPKDSADEARYAARYLGDSLLAFEIGNEPDLYIAHKDRQPGYSYPDFLKEWQATASALRAAVPGAPLCGPGAFNAWEKYGLPFAHDAHAEINILTQHYYRMSGKKPEATLASLLTGLPALFNEVQKLVQAAAANGIPGGFRMIETNTFVGGGLDGVSDRTVAALWAVEFALRSAELGARGLNFQIGPKSHSNSAIAMGPGASVSEVRPQFYALALLADLGTGAMLRTSTPDGSNVSAFCVDSADGKRNVVINNFNEGAPIPAEIRAGNIAVDAETMLLDGRALTSPTCTLGGDLITTAGAGKARWTPITGTAGIFRVMLPPASILRLRV